MPDRIFDPAQHPRRVSYVILVLATILAFALGALIIQVKTNQKQSNRISAINARLDTQQRTAQIACEQGKPGNTQFLKELITYFANQERTAKMLLRKTPKDSLVYGPRKASLENYESILKALRKFLPIRCDDA